MSKAVIFPYNPRIFKSSEEGIGRGSVNSHFAHLKNRGKVFWSLTPAGGNISAFEKEIWSDIKVGYLYSQKSGGGSGKVTHKIEIEKSINVHSFGNSRLISKNEWKYLPLFRAGDGYDDWGIFILITKFSELNKKHDLNEFKKWKNGKEVERVQNYCIVKDPNLKATELPIDERLADKILNEILTESISEKDIENVYLHYLLDEGYMITTRQLISEEKGRLDVVYSNKKGITTIVEIKKGIADISALNQVKSYMKNKRGIKREIVASDFAPEVKKRAEKENIKLRKFRFRIEFE